MHLDAPKTKKHHGDLLKTMIGLRTNRVSIIARVAAHKWRLIMDKRFVNTEFTLLKRLAAFISDLLYAKEDLENRLALIPDGQNRMDNILDSVSDLLKDILSTGPENQKKQLYNVMKDYKVELMPRLSSGSKNIIMTKSQAKQLIDVAQEKCKSCVEDCNSAKKCALYQLLEITAIPDSYDTLLCPYSRAVWRD